MTLCVVVSAYCGSHVSLTNVSQIFKYTNLLLKRCSKIGEGDVMLLFQDIYGEWTKYKWMNWIQNNGRKLILNNVSQQQNVCLQQLQKQSTTSAPMQNNNSLTMLNQIEECILDCKKHNENHSQFSYIYHIAIIGNENCLSFNDNSYLNKNKSFMKLKQILSLTKITPININMICLCSPLKNNKKYQEFQLINNCCSVCYQQFFRTKPNKKQHFPKSCHQIALKQIKIQKYAQKCPPLLQKNNSNEPPFKKQKIINKSEVINENKSDDDVYDITDVLVSNSVLFYQKLIDTSGGIFRWILTDFNQSNIDLVFQSLSNRIASHTKLRYIAMGTLMGKCMIFPGPNNNYFVSPNNLNNKIIKFENLNETQLKFEINKHMKEIPIQYNNSFIKTIYKTINNTNENNYCPLNILQENNVNISNGCDIVSILGFLDRENQWLSIPILSRHFIIPYVNTAGKQSQMAMDVDTGLQNTNKDADICVFVKELLYKYNKIALVSLNPPNKPNWYGFIHSDLKTKGQYLLLDVLSPYINVEELLYIENQQKPTPQYTIQNINGNNESKNNDLSNNTMLNVYDSVSSYFPTETNVIKEFDKFIRLFKQKKVLECFEIAESIRKRALMFHIPHLIKHLLSIINKELNNIAFELPKENGLKHQLDVMVKLINESQNDKRVKIVWNPPSNNNKKQKHNSQRRSQQNK